MSWSFLVDKKPTPLEFANAMRVISINASIDREDAHARGDDLMCKVLEQLGYEEGVKVFRDMEKWYS